jgi:hypothetical protein
MSDTKRTPEESGGPLDPWMVEYMADRHIDAIPEHLREKWHAKTQPFTRTQECADLYISVAIDSALKDAERGEQVEEMGVCKVCSYEAREETEHSMEETWAEAYERIHAGCTHRASATPLQGAPEPVGTLSVSPTGGPSKFDQTEHIPPGTHDVFLATPVRDGEREGCRAVVQASSDLPERPCRLRAVGGTGFCRHHQLSPTPDTESDRGDER